MIQTLAFGSVSALAYYHERSGVQMTGTELASCVRYGQAPIVIMQSPPARFRY